MNIGWATDVGNVREINEDTVVAETLAPEATNPEGLTAVLVVADGMGGHQAGEIASGLAGSMTRQAFLQPALLPADSVAPGTSDLPDSQLAAHALEVVRQINEAVFAYGGQGTAHPGTTLTLCLCRERDYTIAHVGDSRAYLLARGSICQVTDDDSWVGEAVRRGTMTLDEARSSHLRNQLTKCIGIAAEVEPSLYQGTWQPGDVLLLCSDGLSEYVLPEELRATVSSASSLQAACDHLVALARERGGHDNISVVAACEGLPQAVSRKPPTWKGEDPLRAMPGTPGGASDVPDPNRVLRPILLALGVLAFLVIGLAAARRHPPFWTRHAIVVPAHVPPHSKTLPAGQQSSLPKSGQSEKSEKGAPRAPSASVFGRREEPAPTEETGSAPGNDPVSVDAGASHSGKERQRKQ